jgi:hypothetical protein
MRVQVGPCAGLAVDQEERDAGSVGLAFEDKLEAVPRRRGEEASNDLVDVARAGASTASFGARSSVSSNHRSMTAEVRTGPSLPYSGGNPPSANRRIKPKALPRVADQCRSERMVKSACDRLPLVAGHSLLRRSGSMSAARRRLSLAAAARAGHRSHQQPVQSLDHAGAMISVLQIGTHGVDLARLVRHRLGSTRGTRDEFEGRAFAADAHQLVPEP